MINDHLLAKIRGTRKSLTIWFNATALTILPLLDALQAGLPLMQQYSNGRMFASFAMTVLLVNIFLRFKTDSDLADKK